MDYIVPRRQKHASEFEGLPRSAAGEAAVKLVCRSASSAVVVATIQEPAGGYQLLEKTHFHIYSLAAASPLKKQLAAEKMGRETTKHQQIVD